MRTVFLRPAGIGLVTGLLGLSLFVSEGRHLSFAATAAEIVGPAYHTVCELIALPYNSFTSVPPPGPMDGRASLNGSAVTVDVTYDAGFTPFPQAQAAFQYAVDIWKTQVTSAIPIRVEAHFTALGANVLGAAGPIGYFINFSNAPFASTWFPSPTANALSGVDNRPGLFHIGANFNSNFANWYFGTDGLPPSGTYDFVSVVLHELGHGLGFLGSFAVSGGNGTWGGGTAFPFVFDRFVENSAGQDMINTSLFAKPSAALAAQLTSNDLYWSGASASGLNGGVRPRMYRAGDLEPGIECGALERCVLPRRRPQLADDLSARDGRSDP